MNTTNRRKNNTFVIDNNKFNKESFVHHTHINSTQDK